MNGRAKSLLNFEISQVKIKTCLLLGLACVAGYWPVSLCLFSLKNDATMYFLPYRYQISNAIRHGEFPFWTPYLYMGFPIHGDMQSGVWNPVVWIISLLTPYNMSVLHAESLLYIFLAGIGMYKLLTEFGINSRIRSAIAVCYMFSGFVTDSGQFIVWLACAAFVPFVFLYFYRLLYRPVLLNAFKASFALCMLLWAGYPSFLIYCCYILLAAAAVRCYGIAKTGNMRVLMRFLSGQLAFALLFVLTALPALLSFAELLPYYSRGAGLSLHASLTDPFSIKCATSFLIPFNLSREDIGFGNDPTMRNTYVGIFSMLFFIVALSRKMSPVLLFSVGIFFLTLLFILGDATPVRALAYRFAPLMNTFRHPANMRLFSSVCILFISAFGVQSFFDQQEERPLKTIKRIYGAMAVGVLGLMLYFFMRAGWSLNIHSFSSTAMTTVPFRDVLKQFFSGVSFPLAILIVGTIQLLFLLFAAFLQRKNAVRYLPLLIIGNALVIGQFSLPSTFVSKVSPREINTFIKKYPSGFPAGPLAVAIKDSAGQRPVHDPTVYGYAFYYNKRIEIPDRVTTPCILKTTDSFLRSPAARKRVADHPVFYLAGNGSPESNNILVTAFHANSFSLSARTDSSRHLNISQNYYKHWKATVDGHPVPVTMNNISFMSIAVPPGTHLIHFEYAPYNIYIAMIISLAAFIIPCCFFVFMQLKRTGEKKQP